MNKQCEIVQDLIPLYIDGACSEASAEMVKEHLKTCSACNDIYVKMSSDIGEGTLKAEAETVIKKHKRKENQQIIKYLFFAVAVLYIPALFIISVFADGDGTFISMPYIFILAVFAIYTFPFYFAFVELGFAVCRVFEKKERTVGEKIFNTIGIALSGGIILTAFDLESLLYPSLALAFLLVLKWIVAAVIYKKKPNILGIFRQKVFWLCVLILVSAVIIFSMVSTFFLATRNVREETLEFGYSAGVRASGSEYEGLYFEIGADEQHSWNIIDKNPTFTVQWVNTTQDNIEYGMDCYIYKQTSDGWGLCSTDYPDFPDEVFTLPAGSKQTQVYSIYGYDIKESGRYKFVTFVDGKAIWVEFEVTIEQLSAMPR